MKPDEDQAPSGEAVAGAGAGEMAAVLQPPPPAAAGIAELIRGIKLEGHIHEDYPAESPEEDEELVEACHVMLL